MRTATVTACLVMVLCVAAPGRAEDFYFVGTTTQLLGEHNNELGNAIFTGATWGNWGNPASHPQIVFEGDGEAYICHPSSLWESIAPDHLSSWQSKVDLPTDVPVVAIRASSASAKGKVLIPAELATGKEPRTFTLDGAVQDQATRQVFLLAKRAHYNRLWTSDIPGAAWFRHQARLVEQELGTDQFQPRVNRRRFFGQRDSALESTYALMSGGRAISENLQLDRELPDRGQPAADNRTQSVAISTLTGITIREFEWKPLIKDAKPDADPLASYIPADQHAVFFKNFQALVRFADESTDAGTPVLRFGEPRAEDARTRQRYEQQLGLSLNEGARLFGPALIRSVAVTGGDLYMRTGTDLAILFEASNTVALQAALETQIAATAGAAAGAAEVEGEQHGITFRGFVTPDRKVSSYVALVDNAVVVTNSLVQLQRITEAAKDNSKSLAALDEYVFFRQRYPRNDDRETALAIISDPTIRRWCGPKWRIATSRRTRATAVMAELQAEHLAEFVAKKAPNQTLKSTFEISDAKTFIVNSEGLRSEIYGNLEFQTPITELELTNVTPEEAALYARWRDTYQQNWSNFFDPIAVRFGFSDERLEADVTVMPLIDASQYDFLVEISKGAKLTPTSGDPHPEALVHWAFAFNPKSNRSASLLNLASLFGGVDAGSWIGKSFSVYVDQDPVWQEIAEWRKAHPDNDFEDEAMEQFLHRLPIAVHIEATNGLKLTAFLTALRAYIDQTAPGMTEWETRKHGDEPYVRIAPSQRARQEAPADLPQDLAVYYAASGKGLTVTLSEDLLKRALDRQVARREANATPDAKPAPAAELLGENVTLDVKRELVEYISELSEEEYQRAMQRLCWNNLPILNEWRRHFPDQDPLKLHEEQWGVRLVCPGGGQYQWNEAAHTMESSVYGHPGAPKIGPKFPAAFADVTQGRFGLSLEEHGIRARVELSRKSN